MACILPSFPAIVGALFGSSNFLVTGPTNPTALVTASVLLAFAGGERYVQMVFLLAILSGVIQAGAGCAAPRNDYPLCLQFGFDRLSICGWHPDHHCSDRFV
jgi:hypothetical protein